MRSHEMLGQVAMVEQLEERLLMSAGLQPKVDGGGSGAEGAVVVAGVRALPDSVDVVVGALVFDRFFSGTVSTANPGRDFNYQFTLAPSLKPGKLRKFTLSLYGMTNDADVDLMNSSGTILKSGEKWGSKSEKISASLPAGTYYIRIHISTYYTGSLSTPFSLELCSKP